VRVLPENKLKCKKESSWVDLRSCMDSSIPLCGLHNGSRKYAINSARNVRTQKQEKKVKYIKLYQIINESNINDNDIRKKWTDFFLSNQ
jgi:hypothetical protein